MESIFQRLGVQGLGLYRDNGKENGSYRNYMDYVGVIYGF